MLKTIMVVVRLNSADGSVVAQQFFNITLCIVTPAPNYQVRFALENESIVIAVH